MFNPFESFWTFVGTFILIGLIFEGLTTLIATWQKRDDE